MEEEDRGAPGRGLCVRGAHDFGAAGERKEKPE